MECNREEAIRARSIAESRMQKMDFEGARNIALKAQRLFPDLDSISQILAVCEVHCAAARKMAGEMDWYAILQVEMTADESVIKKQYRKLALLLHPDKNKLAGAEAAFQQVGDAYKILSDPAKRSQRNMLSGVPFNAVVRQTYRPSMKKHPGPGVSNTAAKSSFAHFSGLKQDQSPPFSSAGAFWTMCPFCNVRFQYHQHILNTQVNCQKCFRRFFAHGLKTEDEPTADNSEKVGSFIPVIDTKSDFINASTTEFQGSKPVDPATNHGTKLEVSPGKCKNKKRNRDASIDSPLPTKRPRQGGKKFQHTVQTNNTIPSVTNDGDRERKENSRVQSDPNASFSPQCKASVDPENLVYTAPEFYDFDSERSESKFAVGQIWALYDNIDGMPRYYARVKKVYSRGFRLQLTWLENDPRSITEMRWSEQGLPISCGSFKLGKSYSANDQHIFSHLVSWRTGLKRNSYVIYPRKGEIWALFRNWDLRWCSEPTHHRVFRYQVVEVISDFMEVAGIKVVRLSKIKKFTALFVRATDTETSFLEIAPNDLLMFSHRIPACRMTGKQEHGVPEGAFELDCASLPSSIGATSPSNNIQSTKSRTPSMSMVHNNVQAESKNSDNKISNATEKSRLGTTDLSSKKMSANLNVSNHPSPESKKVEASEKTKLINEVRADMDNICSQNPSLLSFEYPESEFYDFEKDRLMENFKCGQIWAFYCEIDGFPKYYGKIRGIDRENNQVHIRWLEKDGYFDESKPPPSCGAFKPTKETCTMNSGESFSYLAKAKRTKMKDRYYIFPNVGEIWAVYRNWSANCSALELRDNKFDIVEISACDASGIMVLPLIKVDGYISVFKRDNEDRESVKLIPMQECAKFSHRIPAFWMESRRGYWELDPAAVPTVLLSSSSRSRVARQ